jgi:4-hydroxythreonine-4-phosphate dehydrogenase
MARKKMATKGSSLVKRRSSLARRDSPKALHEIRFRRNSARLPLLGLTMGDPAGIGPEVIAKALAGKALSRLCRPIVIGSHSIMEATIRTLRLGLRVMPVEDPRDLSPKENQILVLDALDKPIDRFDMGLAATETGAASVAFIKKGVNLALAGQIDGIVTGPINKEAMNMAGFHYPGHTELLADLTESAEVGMMIVGGPLKIMFTTTHVAIRDLSSVLTPDRIAKAIRLAHRGLREYFGIAKPKIGVAALNPHAGEHGLFGDEEDLKILPAVRQARTAGIDASDPMPADTLFGKAARGAYDGIVAMYHDQGLIPLKLVAFGTCVNVTVGLPIIRTSVDHGTAYDIAGKGVADPGSLLEAVKLAARLAVKRNPST